MEVAFPSSNFNARHGTAVFTCVGGPTPWGVSNRNSNIVCMSRKHGHIADARKSLRIDRVISLHVDSAIIAMQQGLHAQRIAI